LPDWDRNKKYNLSQFTKIGIEIRETNFLPFAKIGIEIRETNFLPFAKIGTKIFPISSNIIFPLLLRIVALMRRPFY